MKESKDGGWRLQRGGYYLNKDVDPIAAVRVKLFPSPIPVETRTRGRGFRCVLNPRRERFS